MYYKNKIVWITGASTGVGEHLAYAFSEAGAKLIISARRLSELERVKNNCKKETEIRILPLDLEKHDELPEKAKEAENFFGQIDILFHNGGISQRSLLKDTSFDVDKRLMNINYFGSVCITKAVLPGMIKNGGGQIAVMSSLTGKFGAPLRSAYAASKHALHGFYDTLRAELYRENISVTIICSGYIRTNIAVNALIENGQANNNNDSGIKNGMNPKVFAKKALADISKKKQEVLYGGSERFGVYIKRFFPLLFSKIIRNKV